MTLAIALVGSYAAWDMVVQRRLLMGGGGAFVVPVTAPSVSTLTSPAEGGGVWFGGPRAIRNGSETIIGYQTGDAGGDVKAVRVTNATGAIVQTAMLYDNFIVDDHSPPSFVVRPDGIVMAAFAYHLGDIYVGIGTSPGVIPVQAQVTNITSQVGALTPPEGYTYASILYLDDEDRYYVFFRYHDAAGLAHLGYTYSDDDGVTWATRTLVQQITYHHVVKNGTDRLDFVTSDHPLYGQGDNPAVKTSIWHMYYDGTWHKSDGTALTPLIGNTAATKVYDGATSRAWLWDIAIGSDGHPRVVYVVYDETFPSGDWHYEWARWTGAAWETHEVADAGGTISVGATPETGNQYAGGIVLDPLDPNRVLYSSNAISGFQLYYAVTSNNGTSWTVTPLTGDADKNVRPVWVQGHGDDIQALAWYGTYTDYFNYSQGIKLLGG